MAAESRAQSALGDLIARITGRNLGALASDAKLEGDLNLNSMDRVELMSALEDRYQVDLKEANFANVSTVGDLERLLHEPQKSPQSGYRYPRWAQRWPITWIREFIYYLLTWQATLIMAHPTIVGSENLHGLDGPFLVSCNHITYIDLGFALKALPPRLRRKLAVGMWGEMLWEMWRPPQNWNWFKRLSYWVGYYLAVALFDVFPLPQQSGVRESFAYPGESVDRGYSVLVFPEGRRRYGGRQALALPLRVRYARGAAQCSRASVAYRRPVRDEDHRPQNRTSRRVEGRNRQAHVVPTGHPAGGNNEPSGRRHLEDVSPSKLARQRNPTRSLAERLLYRIVDCNASTRRERLGRRTVPPWQVLNSLNTCRYWSYAEGRQRNNLLELIAKGTMPGECIRDSGDRTR